MSACTSSGTGCFCNRLALLVVAAVVTSSCRVAIVVEASSFPGTIKQHPHRSSTGTSASSNANDDWWHAHPVTPSSNSDDDEGESSSDWEWDDSVEETDEDNEDREPGNKKDQEEAEEEGQKVSNNNNSNSAVEDTTNDQEVNEDEEEEKTHQDAVDKEQEGKQTIDGNKELPQEVLQTKSATAATPSSSPRKAAAAERTTSSKPLQTLEKLQQMLDETDYMTSSGRPRRRVSTHPAEEQRTTNSSSNNSAAELLEEESIDNEEGGDIVDDSSTKNPLWTSKDRSKYKKQQKRRAFEDQEKQQQQQQQQYYHQQQTPNPDPRRRYDYQQNRIQEQTRLQQQKQQQMEQRQQQTTPMADTALSSDVDDPSDTDDGLGYTLPNLPVYFSDAEGDESDDSETVPQQQQPSAVEETSQEPQQTFSSTTMTTTTNDPFDRQYYSSIPPPPPHPLTYLMQHQQQHQVTGSQAGTSSQQQGGANHLYSTYPYNRWYGPAPPYGYPGGGYMPPPPQQQQQQQYYGSATQQQQQQQGGQPIYGWQSNGMAIPPYPYYHPRQYVPRLEPTISRNPRQQQQQQQQTMDRPSPQAPNPYPILTTTATDFSGQVVETVVEEDNHDKAATIITQFGFDSFQKMATCLILSAVVCYSAVSPFRNLSLVEYNQKFYEILRIASLTTVPPILVFLLIVDMAENNINRLVSGFYHAFTLGYVLSFVAEIMSATVIRLLVFCVWEPDVFQLAPHVPLPLIPWVLREHKYRPTRMTLLVQDFFSSCVVCPFIEEFMKLAILQWSVPLPKNFQWVTKRSKSNHRKKKRVAEPIVRSHPDENDVTKVNHYVSSMLAVSLGLKLADSIRRVCMYTKESHSDKSFYAVFRGIFPIQELCGTMTALGLARRDVLGQKMPLWKLLLPAVIIHGMANFRGMKPIFKWNAAMPWAEMQLSPKIVTDDATLYQLAGKALPKVLWLIILCRVTGYCVKNYYLINRQAVKRTTTYAGNHAAFSAELAATEMLKVKKNSKD